MCIEIHTGPAADLPPERIKGISGRMANNPQNPFNGNTRKTRSQAPLQLTGVRDLYPRKGQASPTALGEVAHPREALSRGPRRQSRGLPDHRGRALEKSARDFDPPPQPPLATRLEAYRRCRRAAYYSALLPTLLAPPTVPTNGLGDGTQQAMGAGAINFPHPMGFPL